MWKKYVEHTLVKELGKGVVGQEVLHALRSEVTRDE